MRERPIRLAWKATRREIGTWVRIPFPPPDIYKTRSKLYEFCYNKPMTEIKYNLLLGLAILYIPDKNLKEIEKL